MNNFNFISYLQAGYTFQRSSESKFSFTPQIAYRISITDKGLDPIDFSGLSAINLTFRYDKYLGGLSNRGILMGMQTEKMRFIAGIGNFGRSRGSYVPGFLSTGNISLRYIFKKGN